MGKVYTEDFNCGPRVQWPREPDEGDVFRYVDTIGGCTWVTFEFRNGKWVFLYRE